MDEPSAVRVLEAAGCLEPYDEGLGRREEPVGIEHRAQASAAEVLEDEVRAVLGEVGLLTPVVDRHDVRMAERRGRPRLGPEPLQEGGVARERRVQQLHRDLPAKLHVVGEVHLR